MQAWLHWRRQDALLVQKHFVALFHPEPNECLRFDLESCNWGERERAHTSELNGGIFYVSYRTEFFYVCIVRLFPVRAPRAGKRRVI